MERSRKAGMVVLCGNSHPEMAHKICDLLGIPQAQCSVLHKSNRETMVEIKESVRGKEVYIVQTGTKNVNDDIMELLIMVYACKTSCAQSIIGVIPYLPYSKQSKMRGRGSIVSRLLADMLCKAGINHIITMDLHQKEIQGFYPIPVDNLRASPFLLQYVRDCIPDYRNAVIVAKNPDSVKRASSYAERLRLGIAVIHGEEKEVESERSDGRNSPPLISSSAPSGASTDGEGRFHIVDFSSMPVMEAKVKPPMNVVGDVGGKIAIMVDDIIDNVETYVAAASVLKERGAYKVYVMATHGLLSQNAPQLLESSAVDEIVVANTVPHDVQKMQCHKIKTVDVSVLFTEAIRRIHNNESMSFLFKNITTTD